MIPALRSPRPWLYRTPLPKPSKTIKEYAMTRYLLDNDDDGHWYLIQCGQEEAFQEYVDSEGRAPFPSGVTSLGSHPNAVTFEAPEHFGEAVA